MITRFEKEYIVFCDESEKKGMYYSNFYGGVIVGATQLNGVNLRLENARSIAGIESEVKWEKTSPYDVERYKILIAAYFDEIKAGHLRTRIMYRQNAFVASGLSPDHYRDEYFILYYQFLKHGFGFAHMSKSPDGTSLRFYLDRLPYHSKERRAQFRGYISALADSYELRRKGVRIETQNIAEIDSKKHILLQCTDVVLGSMAFRLNDKHKFVPEGKKRRGKRTIAKETLYKFILSEICRVTGKSNFNIGISTGKSKHPEGLWKDPYLHWKFTPREHSYDKTQTKPKKTK